MLKIIILYTDAGGGHKAAAKALTEMLQQQMDCTVQLFNPYIGFGADIDLLKKVTGKPAEEIYNKFVSSRGTAMFSLLLIAFIFKVNLAIFNKRIIAAFRKLWEIEKPSLVISVTPFINKYVAKSMLSLSNKIPFVTLVTDYSECVRGVWLASKYQTVICASEKIASQALQRKIEQHKIHRVSGIVVAPKFYASVNLCKTHLRGKLGLDPNVFTGLIMFGSHGTEEIIQVVRNMCAASYPIQLIVICGNNTQVQEDLRSLNVDYALVVVGFVENVNEYMRCADFMIGKPGGLSISEAVVMRLPMIIKSNIFTLLQERYNAKWIIESKVGFRVKNFHNIRQDVARMQENLAYYHANFANINNQAIFEIPKIVREIICVA